MCVPVDWCWGVEPVSIVFFCPCGDPPDIATYLRGARQTMANYRAYTGDSSYDYVFNRTYTEVPVAYVVRSVAVFVESI